MMQLAIMQPYFFPYIGYFQLMKAVDEFMIYDNIEYTKKGWINRNRILVNGKDTYLTLPLKKDSDYLTVLQRSLTDNWNEERKKVMNRITGAYHKAPYFRNTFPIIEQILFYEEKNLFKFLANSLLVIKEHLGIITSLTISSQVMIDHSLKGGDKVIEICKARKATTYINPIGGVELYDRERFLENGITIKFLKANNIQYIQFANDFVPFLSIIDVMMFNSIERVNKFLEEYTLI